jgi:hypothetical protein
MLSSLLPTSSPSSPSSLACARVESSHHCRRVAPPSWPSPSTSKTMKASPHLLDALRRGNRPGRKHSPAIEPFLLRHSLWTPPPIRWLRVTPATSEHSNVIRASLWSLWTPSLSPMLWVAVSMSSTTGRRGSSLPVISGNHFLEAPPPTSLPQSPLPDEHRPEAQRPRIRPELDQPEDLGSDDVTLTSQ